MDGPNHFTSINSSRVHSTKFSITSVSMATYSDTLKGYYKATKCSVHVIVEDHDLLTSWRSTAGTAAWIASFYQSFLAAATDVPCPRQGRPLVLTSPAKPARIWNLQKINKYLLA